MRTSSKTSYRIDRIATRQDRAGFTNFFLSVPGKNMPCHQQKSPRIHSQKSLSGFFIDGNNIVLIASRNRYSSNEKFNFLSKSCGFFFREAMRTMLLPSIKKPLKIVGNEFAGFFVDGIACFFLECFKHKCVNPAYPAAQRILPILLCELSRAFAAQEVFLTLLIKSCKNSPT